MPSRHVVILNLKRVKDLKTRIKIDAMSWMYFDTRRRVRPLIIVTFELSARRSPSIREMEKDENKDKESEERP